MNVVNGRKAEWPLSGAKLRFPPIRFRAVRRQPDAQRGDLTPTQTPTTKILKRRGIVVAIENLPFRCSYLNRLEYDAAGRLGICPTEPIHYEFDSR